MSTTISDLATRAEATSGGRSSQTFVRTLKPRCALKVAVVGNRRFGGESDHKPTETAPLMKRQASEGAEAVWEMVAEAMASALEMEVPVEHQRTDDPLPRELRLGDFYGPDKPRLAILSSLAAGADQIGAEKALEVGRTAEGVEVELEAVLPFAEADYPGRPGQPRPEFRPEEAATLRSLATQARQVVRLDGRYDEPRIRNHAYQQARDMLLQHADLLVAIYDPQASGGPAGTLEMVDRALVGGVPVLAILVTERDVRIALYRSSAERPSTPDDEWAGAHAAAGDGWRSRVAHEVRRLLALPRQLPTSGEDASEGRKRLKGLAESVNRLRLLYGEAPPHRWCRGPVSRAVFGGCWKAVLRAGSLLSPSPHLGESPPEPERPRDEVTLAPYADFYDRASELSESYMRTYRGAFVLAFFLAGVAVAAAVGLMAVSHPEVSRWIGGERQHWLLAGSPPLLATLVLGFGKVFIIGFLIMLERVNYQARYQEHATDFRYLAEKLRPMPWLAPMGTLVPAVDMPAHLAPQDPRRAWMPWLVRAVARSTPAVSIPATLDGASSSADPRTSSPTKVSLDGDVARSALERARSEWLQGQVLYHWNNARRMHALDEGLERLAKRLLWTVLGLAAVALVLKLLYQIHSGLAGETGELGSTAALALSVLERSRIGDIGQFPFLLGAGAASLPAFIAALAGIMFQSEARRLTSRSEAMYHALRARQRELGDLIVALSAPGEERGGVAWPAAQHLRALAEMTIGETGDWKVLYETHEIHAG